MAGENFGFNFDEQDNIWSLEDLYNTVSNNIKDLMNQYKITEQQIVCFDIIYRHVDSKFLIDLKVNKQKLEKKKI